jgi:uracil-xanthine permease
MRRIDASTVTYRDNGNFTSRLRLAADDLRAVARRASNRAGRAMSETGGYFPRWRLKTEGRILPDERLPTGQTVVLGFQHVVAMFGSTVLAPILMGFDPNVSILFSGISTLIFFIAVGGRVPSYLGSSFAFIGPVLVATGAAAGAVNPDISLALGGIIAAGALYTLIGLLVMFVGHRWIERLMPPVLTGAIVAAIGLVLAPIAVSNASGSGPASPDGDQLSRWIAITTFVAVGVVAVYAPGMARRLPILIGGAVAYIAYMVVTNGLGFGAPVDFSGVAAAAWFGWPHFTAPTFSASAITLIAPVVIILVAENLGHIKAIGAMTDRDLDPYLGRAFIGDGIATMFSGAFGGTGMTTYAENMGVMAVTRIFSTLVFLVAAAVAIILGFSPKFGALIQTIPGPVIGGLSIVVFGLIAATAGRIWVENKVDFSEPRNLITVGVALVLGAGNFKLQVAGFTLDGIGTATIGAIALYHLLGMTSRRA